MLLETKKLAANTKNIGAALINKHIAEYIQGLTTTEGFSVRGTFGPLARAITNRGEIQDIEKYKDLKIVLVHTVSPLQFVQLVPTGFRVVRFYNNVVMRLDTAVTILEPSNSTLNITEKFPDTIKLDEWAVNGVGLIYISGCDTPPNDADLKVLNDALTATAALEMSDPWTYISGVAFTKFINKLMSRLKRDLHKELFQEAPETYKSVNTLITLWPKKSGYFTNKLFEVLTRDGDDS